MPTIDIPDKICSHCGGITYKVQYQGKYVSHRCIVLDKEWKKQYRLQNRESLKIISKANYYKSERYKKSQERKTLFLNKTHSECIICKQVKSVSNFRKVSKFCVDKKCNSCRNKKRSERSVKDLRDTYVAMCIIQKSKLSREDIPQDLIEVKRKQLLLKRQLKLGEASKQASVGTLLPKP